MGGRESEVEAFLSGVNASRTLWSALDFRVVAARVENEWHNLITRCTLVSRSPSEVLRLLHLPKTADLLADQLVLGADALEHLVQQVLSGSVVINGETVRYLTGTGGQTLSKPYDNAGYSRTNIRFDDAPVEFSAGHRLTIRGENAGDIFYRFPGGTAFLDSSLRQLDRPWDGINAVTLHAAGVWQFIDGTSTRRIDFIAPLEAKLDSEITTLHDDELVYTAVVGSRAVREKCTLGIFGISKSGQIISESLPLHERRWRVHSSGYSYTGRRRFRHVRQLTLILRVGDFDLPSVRLTNVPAGLPPLAAAYGMTDPKLKRFRELLFTQDGSKSKEFERAVNRLFRFAGFIADDLLDNPRGTDALDGLAFEPVSRVLLAIECTTGAINQDGKLAKLYRRVSELRAQLGTKSDVEVVPLIVTFLPVDELLGSERAIATEQGIRIVAREGLEQILELVMAHTPVQRIVELFHPNLATAWLSLDRNPLAG
jgi:hypothetical protein